MDNLYIGAKYDAGIVQYEDGTAIDFPVTAVLYDRQSKRAYEKLNVTTVSPALGPHIVWDASETKDMIPAMYDLELYKNYNSATEREMIGYERDYVKAQTVSATDLEESSSN